MVDSLYYSSRGGVKTLLWITKWITKSFVIHSERFEQTHWPVTRLLLLLWHFVVFWQHRSLHVVSAKKSPKCQKIYFWHFLVTIFKNKTLIKNQMRKHLLDSCLNILNKQFQYFNSKLYIFCKIWYQKWILWLISIPEIYTFIYITVIV